VPALAKHFRVVTYDARGWGLSYDTDDKGPEAFIDDLRGLLDALEVDHALLGAQSMGGLACLGVAMAQPERVRGLLLANTFAGMRRAVWLASTDGHKEEVRAIWERRRSEGSKRVLAPSWSQANRDKAFLYKQIRLLNEHGPNRLDSARQVLRLRALERTDVGADPEQLAALPMPVLFIGGELDEVMPVSLMEIAKSLIPGAQMHVVPGAAHSVYFEAPDVFNAYALEFFQNCVNVTFPNEGKF
jgi:pimeloyl-ACP methyl ester carboxylesterase